MKLTAFLLSTCLLLVTACSDDQPASQAAAPAAQPSSSPAPAAPAAMAPAASGDEEELVYDPIDVSKLDNQWWKQYSASGG